MDRKDLEKFLGASLVLNKPPADKVFYSVLEHGTERLAAHSGISLNEAMVMCLRNGIWPERFRAQRGTFTADEQIRLLQSSVAVIGAGGLGGTLSLLLARAGVGSLSICDGDTFEESNLNRQMLSSMNRLGRNKAECAAEEIKAINPAVNVVPYALFATDRTFPDIIREAQVAVDCLDNHKSRYQLEDACHAAGIPFVHGTLAGLEGFVLTVFPGDPGLRSVYGPLPVSPEESAESVVGTPTITPAMIAGLEAAQVLDILTGRAPGARCRMIHLDLSMPEIETIILK